MINNIRDFLSRLVTKIQIKWMEQYGDFDESGRYTVTKSVPTWVHLAQRKLGYLALSLDPRKIEDIEIIVEDNLDEILNKEISQ
ncbi:MAG: hypothetical protein QNJ54_31730 [Prochloraceae cyanobacterium]|nr:hypothetical protein [Prochloraceae cyanobacterium]